MKKVVDDQQEVTEEYEKKKIEKKNKKQNEVKLRINTEFGEMKEETKNGMLY